MMIYPFPDPIRQLLDERLASGRYASEDEVLVQALQSLKEHDEVVADIQEGLEDEAAGRVRPLREFDAELRQTLGFPT
ncbi:MAG: type II toxin-antitoxin system ParD family antitoxin [Planctomycetota bacterium]|nr:type II toxin-antitoxin system ParD family antitoxin [Planctomycetota bacterium]